MTTWVLMVVESDAAEDWIRAAVAEGIAMRHIRAAHSMSPRVTARVVGGELPSVAELHEQGAAEVTQLRPEGA